MAWEISITDEGWEDIHKALTKWTAEDLAKALGDYNYEKWHGYFSSPANIKHIGAWKFEKLMKLYTHEQLVELCYAAIGDTNTCDNGGYFYWIDPEGYHKVELTDSDDDDDGVDERDRETAEYQEHLRTLAAAK